MPFLLLALIAAKVGCASASLTPQEKVAHLYDRLAYGMTPAEAALWKNPKNTDEQIHHWIEEQLHPERISDSEVEQGLAHYRAAKLTAQQTHARYRKLKDLAAEMGMKDVKDLKGDDKKALRQKIGKENLPEAIVRDMAGQRILRAIRSHRQLQEVLVDFWLNHFNVDSNKGEVKWLLPTFERETIRPHIFGHFADLLRATAHDPAMLFYLDNHLSRGPNKNQESGLNENYAREILELHTLGVDGGYAQKDVTELARILTGWSIADLKDDAAFKFKPRIHDQGAKHFLGMEFPAGGGEEEGERALAMIASHPSTAKFISTKLARFFVSDNPPPALVARLAHTFTQSHGDLREVYKELFTSPEFWSRDAYRSKIKKPSQFVFSAVRALDGDLEETGNLPKVLAEMGEDLYKCPPPTGYKDIAGAWVNPGAMVYRLNFALRLAGNRIDGLYAQLPAVDRNIHESKKFIDNVAGKLLHEKLSATTERVVLKEFDPESHQMLDGEVRPFSLVKATGMILGSPEFQRR